MDELIAGTHAGADAARTERWSACSAIGAWRDRNADAWAVHAGADGRFGLAVADGVSSSEGSWAVSAAPGVATPPTLCQPCTSCTSPPQTMKPWPVTSAACSLARKTTSWAGQAG